MEKLIEVQKLNEDNKIISKKVPENLLSLLIKINADIKWESSPKNVIEAMLLEFMIKEEQNG